MGQLRTARALLDGIRRRNLQTGWDSRADRAVDDWYWRGDEKWRYDAEESSKPNGNQRIVGCGFGFSGVLREEGT